MAISFAWQDSGLTIEILRNIQRCQSWPRRNTNGQLVRELRRFKLKVNCVKSLSLSTLAAVGEPFLAEIFCFMSLTTPHIAVAMPRTFCITSTFLLQPRIFVFLREQSVAT